MATIRKFKVCDWSYIFVTMMVWTGGNKDEALPALLLEKIFRIHDVLV